MKDILSSEAIKEIAEYYTIELIKGMLCIPAGYAEEFARDIEDAVSSEILSRPGCYL